MGVYTIAGGKGGVGKTTTVASIAVALHDAGESVALIDADLSMANLAAMIDVEHGAGIHQVLAGDADLADVTLEIEDGLTIVPGDHGLDLVSEADPANLREVVTPLAERHDVVLVDTGAGLDHETLVATGLADGVLLTTTQHTESIADTKKTAEFVEHANAKVLGAVLTRTEPDTDLASVADELDMPLFGAIPEDPTLETDPAIDGEAGLAYESLAASLLSHCRGKSPVPAPAAIDRETATIDLEPATDASAVTDAPAVATDGGTATAATDAPAGESSTESSSGGGLLSRLLSIVG